MNSWKAYELADYLYSTDAPPAPLVVAFHPFGYPFGAGTHDRARPDLIDNPPQCVREAMDRHKPSDDTRRVIIYDPAQDAIIDLNPIITR